jgi:hypothetical protein
MTLLCGKFLSINALCFHRVTTLQDGLISSRYLAGGP